LMERFWRELQRHKLLAMFHILQLSFLFHLHMGWRTLGLPLGLDEFVICLDGLRGWRSTWSFGRFTKTKLTSYCNGPNLPSTAADPVACQVCSVFAQAALDVVALWKVILLDPRVFEVASSYYTPIASELELKLEAALKENALLKEKKLWFVFEVGKISGYVGQLIWMSLSSSGLCQIVLGVRETSSSRGHLHWMPPSSICLC
jgi:hypothetical protein